MDDGARPTITVGDLLVDGPRLWNGVVRWVEAFRAAGLQAGNRLVVALPSGPAFAEVALAALWDGLTLAPVSPDTDPVQAAATYDPTAAVAPAGGFSGRAVAWAFHADPSGGPLALPSALRPTGPPIDEEPDPTARPLGTLTSGRPTPEVRLLTPAIAVPSWVALSDANLRHTVDGVLDSLRPIDARWLSVLPWWRSDGLMVDLLPAVFSGAEIVRPKAEGPDGLAGVAEIADLVEVRRPTHAVLPLPLVRELAAYWGGLSPLRCLLDGIVTGPGVDAELAAALSTTNLRTHRGAPELSNLVTLGEPGVWRPGVLGRPIGCRLDDDLLGAKAIRGVNLCYGTWHDATLTVEDPARALRVTFG
jgi:hypothetical protein